jgi:hypothetical protein
MALDAEWVTNVILPVCNQVMRVRLSNDSPNVKVARRPPKEARLEGQGNGKTLELLHISSTNS